MVVEQEQVEAEVEVGVEAGCTILLDHAIYGGL